MTGRDVGGGVRVFPNKHVVVNGLPISVRKSSDGRERERERERERQRERERWRESACVRAVICYARRELKTQQYRHRNSTYKNCFCTDRERGNR